MNKCHCLGILIYFTEKRKCRMNSEALLQELSGFRAADLLMSIFIEVQYTV